jgi:hypothetical protein
MIAAVIFLRAWIDRPVEGQRSPIGRDVADGFSYIVRTPQIATLFLLALTFALFARPVFELLPAVAGDVFNGGPEVLTGLMSAQGIGALFGATAMLRRRAQPVLVRITFVAGVGLSAALIAFSSTSLVWVALPVMAVAGLCHVTCNIGMQAMAQMYAAPGYQGRVLGLYGLLIRTAPSIAAFGIGLGAALVDLQVLIGVAAGIAGVGIAVLVPRARRVYSAR